MTVIWTHNNGPLLIAPPNEIITAGNTTTLLIVNPRPSDTGGYQCTFVELNLRRIILLGELFIVLLQYALQQFMMGNHTHFEKDNCTSNSQVIA